MKRSFILLVSLLAIGLLFAAVPDAATKSKKKKGVILSTVDIDEDYEVLGLVYYRSSELSPKRIHSELKEKARKMGADYVIGITYYSNAGYLYGSGTAVKLIEKNKSKK